jgi:aspartyl-tRNA(Asn)/glutamyl-tRNA(Gln) amidotransferase subunit B
VIQHTRNSKAAANWLQGPVKSYLNENNAAIKDFPVAPKGIAQLVQLVDDGKVNFSTAASRIFNAMLTRPEAAPLDIANELNLVISSDSNAIEQWVDEVLAKMPDKVLEYKKGKKGLIGLFTGEVKKLSKGKADIKAVNELLLAKLS